MTDLPFFVYGTLRRGQGNHRLLAATTATEFRATLGGHALYGPGLPYVTAGEDDSAVVGELIFVAPEHYAEVLARLEGYHQGRSDNHYDREARTVRYVDAHGTDATAVAWVYLAGRWARARLRPEERIAGGDWLEAGLAVCGR